MKRRDRDRRRGNRKRKKKEEKVKKKKKKALFTSFYLWTAYHSASRRYSPDSSLEETWGKSVSGKGKKKENGRKKGREAKGKKEKQAFLSGAPMRRLGAHDRSYNAASRTPFLVRRAKEASHEE